MTVPIVGALLRRIGGAFDLTKLDMATLKAERDRVVVSSDSRNPPITRVLPVTRVVVLGGEPRLVDELRLGDVALMQAWLEEQAPHPLEGIPPEWADPEPSTRRARLKAAWDASASWPPRYGTPAGSILLGSPQGRAYFLTLCLRRSDPGFGLAGAVKILEKVTPTEWAALRRVAYGINPREEVADELAPDETPGRTANWCLSIHRAARCDGGPGYLDVADWTLSQWRNFCNEGQAEEMTPAFAARSKRAGQILEGIHGQ